MIRPAQKEDISAIMKIYERARRFMAETGNPTQWGNSNPAEETILADLKLGQLYVVTQNNKVHGVFVFMIDEEPNYIYIADGSWKSHTPYRAIHRVASDGTIKGMVAQCMEFCRRDCSHLRIDTHENNRVMQHVLEKNGFVRCGTIFLPDGSPRIAYEWDAAF